LFFSWNKKTIFCCVSKAHLTVKHCPKRMHVSTNMIDWKSVQTCKFSRGLKGGEGGARVFSWPAISNCSCFVIRDLKK
jgi:hypothetical protein